MRKKFKPKIVDLPALYEALVSAEKDILHGDEDQKKYGETLKRIILKRIEQAEKQLAEPKKIRPFYSHAEATAKDD